MTTAPTLRLLLASSLALLTVACGSKDPATSDVIRQGSGSPGIPSFMDAQGVVSPGVPGDPQITYRDSFPVTRTVSGAAGTYYGAVGGFGDTIGYYYRDGSPDLPWKLALTRYDPSFPDDLVDLGSTYLHPVFCYQLFDLRFSEDWATVSLRQCNAGPRDGKGMVSFVSLAGGIPERRATLQTELPPQIAVASGRWAALAQDTTLTLFDLVDPDHPVTIASTDARALISSVIPVADGFAVFTAVGHGHLVADAVSPSWVSTTDRTARNLVDLEPVSATTLLAAGPGYLVGRSRIGTLDLSDPGAPTFTPLAEVDGNYAGFHCDGDGTCVLKVSHARSSGMIPSLPVYSFHLFEQRGGGLTYLEERPVPDTSLTVNDMSLAGFYVRAHRLYLPTGGEFQIRRLP